MRHSLAAVGLFVLAVASAQPALSQTPSLTGSWKLNARESDDAKAKLELAGESGMKVSDGRGMSRGIRTGAGRLDGERGGGQEARAVSLPGPDFGRVLRPAELIKLEQNDTILIISDDRSLPQVFYLDGRKVEEPTAGAEPKQTTAKFSKDGKLTIERKLGGDGSIKETYVLDAAKRQLVVEAKLTSPMVGKTVEVRRVYDGN